MVQITRDETLSRLPLRLSTNRVVELVQLRDTVRPVSLFFLEFMEYLGFKWFLIFLLLLKGYTSGKERDSDSRNAKGR